MNPSRSTLRENISSAVSITLNDVMEDLKDLSWQECCVTSIKILNSHQDEAKEKHNSFSELQKSTVIAKFTKPIEDASAASTSSFAGVEIGQKSKKWVKKRKRNARGVANSTLAWIDVWLYFFQILIYCWRDLSAFGFNFHFAVLFFTATKVFLVFWLLNLAGESLKQLTADP